jgi:hypothetical protein
MQQSNSKVTWAAEDMTDWYDNRLGHGNCVTSLVGGIVYGVASKAEIVVLKFTNGFDTTPPTSTGTTASGFTAASALWAWNKAISLAKTDLASKSGSQMKAVINFSAGKQNFSAYHSDIILITTT